MEEEKYRDVPRDEKELRDLKNRIHRLSGQLAGIEKMLEENRYCGDVLIQIAAVQSGLHNLGAKVLNTHMKTCVARQVRDGNDEVLDELSELIEKLK